MPLTVEHPTRTTRDGAEFVIRPLELADAPPLLAYAEVLFAEPDAKILVAPGELELTLEFEENFIRQHEPEGNRLMGAFHGEEVIGLLGFRSGTFRRMRHCGSFGMSVARAWRGRGVGSALLRELLAWGEAHPVIERVELSVFADNLPAIRLYERLGFEHEGCRRGAIREGERRIDLLFMAKRLGRKAG